MAFGRRRFVASLTAGSAAYLAGCTPSGVVAPAGDGGTGCPTPFTPVPPVLRYPSSTYFDGLSGQLDARTVGTPVVLVDLDRLEENVRAIASGIRPHAFRIVEKSLPSIDLLRHVTQVAEQEGAEHFLVLHLPLLGPLLDAFPGADVLVGKTHLPGAIERFLRDRASPADAARRVTFLVDGPDRLAGLVALAGALGVRLRLAIELDVGLRRSGLREPADLAPMLATFQSSPSAVELVGLLGYDGHVAHSPTASAAGVIEAWSEATSKFQEFVDVLVGQFSGLVTDDFLFHSGGSSTYPLYSDPTRPTPVNDVATGGGVLRPGEYPDYFLGDLSPAFFVAAPALRVYRSPDAPPEIPFFDAATNARLFGGRTGVTVYGGGWASYFSYPSMGPVPLSGGGGSGCSWVPNQGLATVAADVDIEDGDWIYYHPVSSDVLFQFERIHLVREGVLQPETWAAYPRRY